MTAKSSSDRLFLWDNLKALLIFLVVFGHAILPFRTEDQLIGGAYIWLNTFHMPLFIFISGLFSKKAVKAEKLNHAKIVSYILVFYFMKLTIYLCVLLVSGSGEFRFLSESGTPWYIFVSAMHLVITRLIKDLNPRKVLVVIFALSLGIGYSPEIGSTLMLSRTIVFYPLFYLGYIIDGNKLLKVLHKGWIRIVSALFFVTFSVAAFNHGMFAYDILNPLYTGNANYSRLPEHLIAFGPLLRAGAYVFCSLVGLSLISIFPSKRIPLISYLGRTTLPVYALHRQILYFYQFSTLPALFASWHSGTAFAALLVGSALLTLILALKPVGYILFPFTNYQKWASPLYRWLKK